MGLTNWFINYQDPNSFVWKLRKKRIKPLINMIERTYSQYGHVNLIDVGGTRRYWDMLPHELLINDNVSITVLNRPGHAFSPPLSYLDEEKHFEYVEGDGCDLSSYDDNTFHIAHSNSVIEHVGDWSKMVKFAHEIRRVASNVFVQTPYYWFPIEPHFLTLFFHWLPQSLRVVFIMHFNLGHRNRAWSVDQAMREVESVRLLDMKMFKELFPGAVIKKEKFLFLTKSLIALRVNDL